MTPSSSLNLRPMLKAHLRSLRAQADAKFTLLTSVLSPVRRILLHSFILRAYQAFICDCALHHLDLSQGFPIT